MARPNFPPTPDPDQEPLEREDLAREEGPSKSQRKRDMHALQGLGEALVELNDERLVSLDLPESLRDAVIKARKITRHEARRRQMQYIGKLMRDIDAEPIRARLAEWAGQSARQVGRHKGLERWRERLLDDDDALTEYAHKHPGIDLQALRALIREARRERAAAQPPRRYRELFRFLQAAEQEPTSGA